MDIFSLLLLIYLSYKNGVKAKQKSLNGVAWGIISMLACFFLEVIGMAIVVVYFCPNVININRLSTDPAYKETAVQLLQQEFIRNPLDYVTIVLFGIGGYLIVRFILDKKPGKQDTPPHWSDKLGENRDS